jgi:hypothetical protein
MRNFSLSNVVQLYTKQPESFTYDLMTLWHFLVSVSRTTRWVASYALPLYKARAVSINVGP